MKQGSNEVKKRSEEEELNTEVAEGHRGHREDEAKLWNRCARVVRNLFVVAVACVAMYWILPTVTAGGIKFILTPIWRQAAWR